MIDDESHPRMRIAQDDLLRNYLGKVLGDGRPLTKNFVDSCFEAIAAHRAKWRQQGVDFPKLVAVAVPRLHIIEFKRADAEIASVRTMIINFVRENQKRGVTMEEVVTAFRVAYPWLKPDDVIEKHESAEKSSERQLERFQKFEEQAKKENGGGENV